MKYRILLADDSKDDIENLENNIKSYLKNKKIPEDDIEIKKAYTIDETIKILEQKLYFDIFFVDINFSEADKTAGNRTGYTLIRKAYEMSPLTYICVYSGVADTKPSYQKEYTNLLKKGLLQDVYKKSFFKEKSEFNNIFKKTWSFVESNRYLWSVWKNHQNIIKQLPINEENKAEIEKNLDSVLFLLKNVKNSPSDEMIYGICIFLYHNCLELICEGNKTDKKIISQATKNAEKILKNEKLIDESKKFLSDFDKTKITAVVKILAYENTDIFKFGYIANKWRNDFAHKNNFTPGISNVLYYNITLSLYCNLDKISILDFVSKKEDHPQAKYNLQDIIGYVQLHKKEENNF